MDLASLIRYLEYFHVILNIARTFFLMLYSVIIFDKINLINFLSIG